MHIEDRYIEKLAVKKEYELQKAQKLHGQLVQQQTTLSQKHRTLKDNFKAFLSAPHNSSDSTNLSRTQGLMQQNKFAAIRHTLKELKEVKIKTNDTQKSLQDASDQVVRKQAHSDVVKEAVIQSHRRVEKRTAQVHDEELSEMKMLTNVQLVNELPLPQSNTGSCEHVATVSTPQWCLMSPESEHTKVTVDAHLFDNQHFFVEATQTQSAVSVTITGAGAREKNSARKARKEIVRKAKEAHIAVTRMQT